MLTFIAATDNCKGIGYKNKIPWHLKKDLKYFKDLTLGKTIVMGGNTYRSIGKSLKGRTNIVLTKNKKCKNENDVIFFDNLNLLIKYLLKIEKKDEIFIIGGEQIYKYFINNDLFKEKRVYLTLLEKKYNCDRFFPVINNEYNLVYTSEKYHDIVEDVNFRFLKYSNKKGFQDKNQDKNHNEIYAQLGKHVLLNGVLRQNRTGVNAYSTFSNNLKFDISNGVPLLTSKRIPWKICIEELLWFLRGETDVKILQEKGIKIWDKNTSRDFLDNMGFYNVKTWELRKGYGHQIRRYGENKIDQLEYIENLLKNDPNSRRIMWNLWNASDLKEMVLTPCHNQVQFYVHNNKLSAQVYCRSSDYFLGLPFNIFSYTVLIYILAKRNNLIPDKLYMTLGDTHIYENHLKQTKILLNRTNCHSYPFLLLNDSIKDKKIEEITIDDFDVVGYFPDKTIKAEMAA